MVISISSFLLRRTHTSPAGLEYNVETPIHWNSEFSDLSDGEELDRRWLETIPWESGIMSVPNAEAELLGLPESQPFPWDPKNTSIYIANGHHVLHCVVSRVFFTRPCGFQLSQCH